jgi:hypothetical protein
VVGPTIELPSVAFRSANFRLQGSGQGTSGRATRRFRLARPSLWGSRCESWCRRRESSAG